MEYYSGIRNHIFMKFLGKCLEVEAIILSELIVTKEHTQYALTDKHILAQKALNNQETIHRPYEAQSEGRLECGCLSPS